jgi:acyl phosphate:glycerol-3-phosphate acyltransferase
MGTLRRVLWSVGLGYIVGTVPTADLVASRAAGGAVDLRLVGSGNPGGMNALGLLGPKAGAAVVAGDIAKGLVACALGAVTGGGAGAQLAGSAAVVGHCHPVWTGFGSGGKGVATSIGQCLATFPAFFPIDAAVAATAVAVPTWKRRAFVATTASSVGWILGAVVWWRRGWPNLWGPRPTVLLPVTTLASSIVIAERFAASG